MVKESNSGVHTAAIIQQFLGKEMLKLSLRNDFSFRAKDPASGKRAQSKQILAAGKPPHIQNKSTFFSFYPRLNLSIRPLSLL
jgi:hypothetical protein